MVDYGWLICKIYLDVSGLRGLGPREAKLTVTMATEARSPSVHHSGRWSLRNHHSPQIDMRAGTRRFLGMKPPLNSRNYVKETHIVIDCGKFTTSFPGSAEHE